MLLAEITDFLGHMKKTGVLTMLTVSFVNGELVTKLYTRKHSTWNMVISSHDFREIFPTTIIPYKTIRVATTVDIKFSMEHLKTVRDSFCYMEDL